MLNKKIVNGLILFLLIITLSFSVMGLTATGGTITTVGGYTIHTFTTNNTFNVTGTGNIEIMIIAGGGGGGSRLAGGGGAGGLLYNATYLVAAGTHNITVGLGGAGGGAVACGTGSHGQNSSFDESIMLAIGGGAGTCNNPPGSLIMNGGSGGAGGGGNLAYGNGTTGQGYRSGFTTDLGGAGGGGAGGNGSVSSVPTANYGGAGGIGLNYSVNGSSFCYAGGGGGSAYTGATAGTASCGGGAGAVNNATASSGVNGTGGGGGASGQSSSSPFNGGLAGRGGDGIVIIRYIGASNDISISSDSPLNNTYILNGNATFLFDVNSITGTWNTTLWFNNSVSYGVNNSITNIGTYSINSLNIPGGQEYLWWVNASYNSTLSMVTETRKIYVAGGSSTVTSCLVNLGLAYYRPNNCGDV